jgi:hypothetical protein
MGVEVALNSASARPVGTPRNVMGFYGGAWGRTRTGTGFPPRDFRTTTTFAAACQACICGLDFTFALPQARSARARVRQGPSSLYTFPDRKRAGLSSVLQAPLRATGSPTLTPFTPAVSEPGAQIAQVPCVYQFRHPGVKCARDCTETPGNGWWRRKSAHGARTRCDRTGGVWRERPTVPLVALSL